jgi:protein-tyrosine phosphatase
VLDAGICALVDLALNEPPLFVPRDLVYCRFPLLDGPDTPPWVVQSAIETVCSLAHRGVATLVFCSAGMSRSPAILAAAISLLTGRCAEECLSEVAHSGPADVDPGLWQEITAVLQTIRLSTEGAQP